MRIAKENFCWLTVTPIQARKIFKGNIFKLYELHGDDFESLIDEKEYLEEIIEEKGVIGIEVGYFDVEIKALKSE